MKGQTVQQTIHESVKRHKDRVAMRSKEGEQWHEVTYGEMGKRIDSIATALIEMGVGAGDKIGIFSQNRPEWSLADLGILSTNAVSVPIYATNTAPQAAYLVKDAELKGLFVGDLEQFEKVKGLLDSVERLEWIVTFDDMATGQNPKILSFGELLERGAKGDLAEVAKRLASGNPEDLATIIYTSGTTGEPKGVMLNHVNLEHQFRTVDESFDVTPDDRSLCFLPLSHVYERTWTYYVYSKGAQNNYIQDPKKVVELIKEVRPTVMVSVPRLYEKVHGMVFTKLEQAKPLKKALFLWALETGKTYEYKVRRGQPAGLMLSLKHRIADKLVLTKIRDAVGGPKKFFSAGGAPLAKEVEEFFLGAGLLVCQGFGLTETSPILTCNTPKDFRLGTVGKPAPDVHVRIAADGEIQVKGPNVFSGYYRKPEASIEAFTGGWFRTGDVGEFDSDGYLRITDRIKNLIITSGGKNLAPQRIEGEIGRDFFIEQMAIIGDKRPYVTALIGPNFDALEDWANREGVSFKSREDLVKNPKVIERYSRVMKENSTDLASYEQVKKFTLLAEPFSQEGGELTPTMKVKRRSVHEKYAAEIEAMYS